MYKLHSLLFWVIGVTVPPLIEELPLFIKWGLPVVSAVGLLITFFMGSQNPHKKMLSGFRTEVMNRVYHAPDPTSQEEENRLYAKFERWAKRVNAYLEKHFHNTHYPDMFGNVSPFPMVHPSRAKSATLAKRQALDEIIQELK